MIWLAKTAWSSDWEKLSDHRIRLEALPYRWLPGSSLWSLAPHFVKPPKYYPCRPTFRKTWKPPSGQNFGFFGELDLRWLHGNWFVTIFYCYEIIKWEINDNFGKCQFWDLTSGLSKPVFEHIEPLTIKIFLISPARK